MTKTGDEGLTDLWSGERVRKDDLRVEAYGTIDELDSVLGEAKHWLKRDDCRRIVEEVQRDLFVAGADVATPFDITEKHQRISHDDVKRLEDHISRLENELEPLDRFILPGGSREAAVLHICRTICRRAERSIVALKAHEELNNYVFVYINRLSDLFFVLARAANKRKGAKDEEWL